jgi:hypothetical protein
VIPHKGEDKDTIEGTTQISAKSPHQMSHVLGSQEEDEKQEFCTSYQKLNGMCMYKCDLERPKWKTFKGCNAKIQAQAAKRRKAKGEIKELEKPNNASNDEPCHARKIRLHNQNTKHYERPHS